MSVAVACLCAEDTGKLLKRTVVFRLDKRHPTMFVHVSKGQKALICILKIYVRCSKLLLPDILSL